MCSLNKSCKMCIRPSSTILNDGYTESLKNLSGFAGIKYYLNMANQWGRIDSLKLYHMNLHNTEKGKENP